MNRVREDLVRMIDRALGSNPKEALIAARQLEDEVRWLQQRAVAVARNNGYDWGRIGRLFGLTRQGARKRFPLAPPAQPPHVVRRNRELRQQREGEIVLRRWLDGTLARRDDDDPVFW